MFDKPNQLVFYVNILLVVFGVLLVLCSDYVVIGLFFVVSALLLIRDQYYQNKSKFTISHLERTLTIHDTCGSRATQTQKLKIAAQHVDNSEFWFKHIHSAGTMSNFKINDNTPAEQKTEDGSLQVCMKFSPDLKVTKEFGATLSYDQKNAFVNTEELLCHVVDTETQLLRLVVELPEGRPASSAHVYCKPEGAERTLLPSVVKGQTKITVDISDPLLGAEYCLQWDWPREGVIQRLGCLLKMD